MMLYFVLQDCELLYLYDRPEKLIITDIAVPPVAIRPSIFMDAGSNRYSLLDVCFFTPKLYDHEFCYIIATIKSQPFSS